MAILTFLTICVGKHSKKCFGVYIPLRIQNVYRRWQQSLSSSLHCLCGTLILIGAVIKAVTSEVLSFPPFVCLTFSSNKRVHVYF